MWIWIIYSNRKLSMTAALRFYLHENVDHMLIIMVCKGEYANVITYFKPEADYRCNFCIFIMFEGQLQKCQQWYKNKVYGSNDRWKRKNNISSVSQHIWTVRNFSRRDISSIEHCYIFLVFLWSWWIIPVSCWNVVVFLFFLKNCACRPTIVPPFFFINLTLYFCRNVRKTLQKFNIHKKCALGMSENTRQLFLGQNWIQ